MSPEFGFLYALTNPAMPGHIKIGMTTRRPEDRVAELSSATGVPARFELAYSRAFENARLAETMVHDRLEQRGLRVTQAREFFQITVDEAVAAIDEVAAHLAQESARELDRERFAHQADLLLAEDRPSTAQLEKALSYLEYAGELGSPVHRYRAAALAQSLAERCNADSTRGQAYWERAMRLYEQAGEEGVVRAHAQRAAVLLAGGDEMRAQLALTIYLTAMPAGEMPEAELNYFLHSLREAWMPSRRVPSLLNHLHPWRAQLTRAARQQYPDEKAFLMWLQCNTHTGKERLVERIKLPALGFFALFIMYLANPGAFFLLTVACAVVGSLVWRSRRRRAARAGGRKKFRKKG